MYKLFLWGLLCMSICCVELQAQRFLQIEKKNSFKTHRIYIGQVVAYELDGEWYERELVDVLLEEQLLVVSDGIIPLSNISAVRLGGRGQFARQASSMLYRFAAAWTVFSGVDAVASDRSIRPLDYMVPAVSLGTGSLIRLLFMKRTMRIGKRWRLRLLDISMPIDSGL